MAPTLNARTSHLKLDQYKRQDAYPGFCRYSDPAKFMLSATLVSVPTLGARRNKG